MLNAADASREQSRGEVTMRNFSRNFFAAACIAVGSTSSAATLLETTKKAPLYPEPSKKAKPMGFVEKGRVLKAVERKGMYWQINLKTRTVYVSILKVKLKTSAESSSFADRLRSNVKSNRKDVDDPVNTRARSTVMGVRGLDSNDVKDLANIAPNLRMVYAMEERSVNISKVDKLQKLIDREIMLRLKRRQPRR